MAEHSGHRTPEHLITKLRITMGWEHGQVARLLHVPESKVREWESGASDVPRSAVKHFAALAQAAEREVDTRLGHEPCRWMEDWEKSGVSLLSATDVDERYGALDDHSKSDCRACRAIAEGRHQVLGDMAVRLASMTYMQQGASGNNRWLPLIAILILLVAWLVFSTI